MNHGETTDRIVPEARTDGLTPACRAAMNYFEFNNQQRFDLSAELFAGRVDYVGPDGTRLQTGAQVREFLVKAGKAYHRGHGKVNSRVARLVPFCQHESFLMLEFYDREKGGYILGAIDHFIVNDEGKIVWFRPFFQQRSSWLNINVDK